MKKIIQFVLLFFLFTACKKVKDIDPAVLSGETLPQYDNTAFGIYKGYFLKNLMIDPTGNNVLSSGNIKIMLNNGTNFIKAYVIIDNSISDTLTCTSTIILGQNIDRVLFTGSISSFRFSVNADGTNPIVSEFFINNRGMLCAVRHETSTQKVDVYEGNFSATVTNPPLHSDQQGQINFIKVGDSLLCTQQFIYATSYYGTGLSSINNFTLTTDYFSFSGAFTTTGCSGTWQPINQGFIPLNGTFIGIKTL